jgi:hypothetical protein
MAWKSPSDDARHHHVHHGNRQTADGRSGDKRPGSAERAQRSANQKGGDQREQGTLLAEPCPERRPGECGEAEADGGYGHEQRSASVAERQVGEHWRDLAVGDAQVKGEQDNSHSYEKVWSETSARSRSARR